MKLHLGLLHECQGPKFLSLHLLPPRTVSRKLDQKYSDRDSDWDSDVAVGILSDSRYHTLYSSTTATGPAHLL